MKVYLVEEDMISVKDPDGNTFTMPMDVAIFLMQLDAHDYHRAITSSRDVTDFVSALQREAALA